MKILVTGAKGFIGKNLVMKLREDKNVTLYECDKDTDKLALEEYCREADFIYHLAGVNRTNDEDEFMSGNHGFTFELLELLNKHKKQCPLMLSSSIQATYNNAYGRSKKAAEDLVLGYSQKNKSRAYIYRLPNIFGKWCKANYNSVIATYCYNIARNLPITIDEPEKELRLVYIDDLIDELISLLKNTDENQIFREIKPFYCVTLRSISRLLYSFRECRANGYIPDISCEFAKKLYSTFLTYLPEEELCYKLRMHRDDRGAFAEFLKTEGNGQISINIIKPGITKGNHYHHTKAEKFLVVSGRGIIRLKHVISGHIMEYYPGSETLEVIDIPAGYTHSIENLGNTDMVLVIWCNEVFDKDNPDTYIDIISQRGRA